jgi:hypothetical protein
MGLGAVAAGQRPRVDLQQAAPLDLRSEGLAVTLDEARGALGVAMTTPKPLARSSLVAAVNSSPRPSKGASTSSQRRPGGPDAIVSSST